MKLTHASRPRARSRGSHSSLPYRAPARRQITQGRGPSPARWGIRRSRPSRRYASSASPETRSPARAKGRPASGRLTGGRSERGANDVSLEQNRDVPPPQRTRVVTFFGVLGPTGIKGTWTDSYARAALESSPGGGVGRLPVLAPQRGPQRCGPSRSRRASSSRRCFVLRPARHHLGGRCQRPGGRRGHRRPVHRGIRRLHSLG